MTREIPWANEPDGGEGVTSGLHWEIKRCVFDSGSWHWCGYVDLPASHPWASLDLAWGAPDALSVHGGITYQEPRGEGIVRIGFDCAHSGDRRANDPHEGSWARGDTFRTYGYVRREVAALVGQCVTAARDVPPDARVDDVAAAVAAERARCAAVCREVAAVRVADWATAEACAEAIERGAVDHD